MITLYAINIYLALSKTLQRLFQKITEFWKSLDTRRFRGALYKLALLQDRVETLPKIGMRKSFLSVFDKYVDLRKFQKSVTFGIPTVNTDFPGISLFGFSLFMKRAIVVDAIKEGALKKENR